MNKQRNFNKEVLNIYVNSTYAFLQRSVSEEEKKIITEKLLKYYKLINSEDTYGEIDEIFVKITKKFMSSISVNQPVTKILDIAEKMYDEEYKEYFDLVEQNENNEKVEKIAIIQTVQYKNRTLSKNKN